MEDYQIPPQTTVGWVELRVADLERALGFYRDVVGLQPVEMAYAPVEGDGQPSVALAATGSTEPLFYLVERPHGRPKPPRTTGLFHTAIRFPSRLALGEVLQRIALQQYPLGGASDHGVSEALYTADPDGNGVELYADRPREQWSVVGGQVAMFTESLDLNALLQLGAGGQADRPAPVGTVIGHVHLQVADLPRSRVFYHQLLGLDVTQESYSGALFLSAGGYHHHLGLNTWAGRGASAPPADALGLAAYSLQIPDAASWQSLVARAEAGGYSPQRRTLPGMGDLALLRDPDGIGVALGVSVPTPIPAPQSSPSVSRVAR
jgi:catechol 2,3-dioxygenase